MTLTRATLCLALLAAIASPAAAQEIRFNVVPYKLENGLKILTLEDHTVPAVSYFTFFKVGSRNERAGRTGISHLFEHMMFNGAVKYGAGEFDRQLESRGGFSNAFTSEDMTGYYEDFPSEALDLVIDMEADRMAALAMTEASLTSEREVVKEERRLRIDNDVEGSIFELLQATAYLAHPYHWPVVGWMEDLDAITVDDCRDYFKTHYAPNNATIIVVGDFKAEQAIAAIGKAYGAIPAQPAAPPVVRSEPPQRGEKRAILRKEAQLPAVAIAWHTPGTSSRDTYVLDLIETILGGGESSRLNRALVRDKELATRVVVRNDWRIDPSLFFVYAEAKPGVEAATLEAALLQEIDAVAKGVDEGELRKAKNIRTTDRVKALKTNNGKGEQLGIFEVAFGSHQKLFNVVREYEAVARDQVARAAGEHLNADNRTIVTLVPVAAAAPAAAERP